MSAAKRYRLKSLQGAILMLLGPDPPEVAPDVGGGAELHPMERRQQA